MIEQSIFLNQSRNSLQKSPTKRGNINRCTLAPESKNARTWGHLSNISPSESKTYVPQDETVILLAAHGEWPIMLCGKIVLTAPLHEIIDEKTKLLQKVEKEKRLVNDYCL